MHEREAQRIEAATGRRPPVRTSPDAHAEVEREFVAERANALGRAGQRLDDALTAWRRARDAEDVGPEQVDAAFDELRDAAWALVVQRECAGFRDRDLRILRRTYELPEAVLRRL